MTTLTTESVQPEIGDLFGPHQLIATPKLIQDYALSTGDTGFRAHAAAMRLASGVDIAPPTIFDRDVGTRLAATRYHNEYGLHAKQSFTFRRPIEANAVYTVAGRLSDIYTKNEVGYFTIEATLETADHKPVLVSSYTRAFSFPGNRHPERASTKVKPRVAEFLFEYGGREDAPFPTIGSIIEGAPRAIGQDLMNLYSGPGSNIHTDPHLARRRGHADAIVQGLMATAIECGLYREVFGAAWYTTGSLSVKYIKPILAGSILTPIGVVTANDGGRIDLSTVVYDQQQELITVGSATAGIVR